MSKTKAKSNGKPSKRSGAVAPATIPMRANQGGGVPESVAESAKAEAELQEKTPPPRPASDFPRPSVLENPTTCIWDEELPVHENYIALGAAIARSGDIYRDPNYGGGLLLASPSPVVSPKAITEAGDLAAIIADRVQIEVVKGDKPKGRKIPKSDLKTMLRCETFLQQFKVVDLVVRVPCYLPDFRLVAPGYNGGSGKGFRIFYAGESAKVATSHDAIDKFLGVMEFSSNADKANTIAGALTVQLRNFWPGGKPIIVATSTKSHGGKETIIDFCCGRTQRISLSFEGTDWALQKNFASATHHNSEVGVINLENARLAKGQAFICSAFVERFLTDPNPTVFSTGTGDPRPRRNNIVMAASTNFGKLSEDLLNRALPINLAPVGDVAARKSPIGNPRHEYLPKYCDQIEAELRGMVEKWKAAGMPPDEDVKHPFTAWAKTIGGVLKVAGYDDFLANYSLCKTQDDPVRNALGLLGVERRNKWLRSSDWVLVVADLGVVKVLIPAADQESPKSRQRGLGTVLSAHQDEIFNVKTDDAIFTLKLKKRRGRFKKSQPHVRYMFEELEKVLVPEDVDPSEVTPPPTD